MAVAWIDKILRYDVAGHLQPRDIGIETAPHLRSRETAGSPQFPGNLVSLNFQYVENRFFDAPFFRIGEEAPPVVAEIGPPFAADERGFSLENLP